MKLQMLIVADYAAADIGSGKLTVVGAFNIIYAQQFPAIHPRLAIAVKLASDNPLETTEPRQFELHLTSEDGIDLFQAATPVQIPRDEKGNRHDANVILEINTLEFPSAGFYEFAIFIDGEKLGDTSIELVQL